MPAELPFPRFLAVQVKNGVSEPGWWCWARLPAADSTEPRSSANRCGQVGSGRGWGAPRAGSTVRTRRRGACAAHAGPKDLTDRGERKQKTKTKPTGCPTLLCEEIVGRTPSEGVQLREAASAHPAPPERGAAPRPRPAPRRVRPGEDVEVKRATRSSGTSRVRGWAPL